MFWQRRDQKSDDDDNDNDEHEHEVDEQKDGTSNSNSNSNMLVHHHHHPIKRHPDQADVGEVALDPPPHKRIHLSSSASASASASSRTGRTTLAAGSRRSRAHSNSMPFNAFSRMHISTASPASSQPQSQPQPSLLQPIPIRPTALSGSSSSASHDVSPHQTIFTSLNDDEDDAPNLAQDTDIPIHSRSPSPPASAHFHLNPALAAQLAANHPFGGGASSTISSGSTLPAAWTDLLRPLPNQDTALVLYRPVKPKPAFVRSEDEERDEDEDEEASRREGSSSTEQAPEQELDGPFIQEIDEEDDVADARIHRSETRRGSRTRSRSRSRLRVPRIVELDGGDAGSDGSRSYDINGDDDDNSTVIYPTYVETPPSPSYASSASTVASSSSSTSLLSPPAASVSAARADQAQPSAFTTGMQQTMDWPNGAPPHSTTLESQYQQAPSALPHPALADVIALDQHPAGTFGPASTSSPSSGTPMAISTGSNTPLSSVTPLHPSLFTTTDALGQQGVFTSPPELQSIPATDGNDEAPMDLD
ncbi:hypothetical protein OC835_003211 [Tilletia horrida]|nr:hypothetical protein OC835_003211 [Tilletia horrida]